MDKTAQDRGPTYTDMGWLLGRINNLRFQNAILQGVLGGGGIAAAAGLLRLVKDRASRKPQETDDDTIVLNIPEKAAESGYESMKGAKPGESRPTANGGTQLRTAGRFGKKITKEVSDAPVTKAADDPAGQESAITTVANTLGMTAGGILAYDVISNLFDRLQERRLKKRLEAAQQAYVNAMSGASKRAELVGAVLARSEKRFGGSAAVKEAGLGRAAFDWIADKLPGASIPRNLAAGYILALLAGTGASAYVTKKVMDREFPEEKPKKDVNRPTRIVFRTVGGEPKLAEYDGETEKEASGETCAAISAMLPIYMDVVEGSPNRTLDPSYVKLAEAMGTDSAGLLKAAADDMWPVYLQILKNQRVLWDILRRTNLGLSMTQRGVVNILRQYHPDVMRSVTSAARKYAPEAYRAGVNKMLEAQPGDGWKTRAGKAVVRWLPSWGQDIAVDYVNGVPGSGTRMAKAVGAQALGQVTRPFTAGTSSMAADAYANGLAKESAADDSMLNSHYYLSSVLHSDKDKQKPREAVDPKSVRTKVKALLSQKRRVSVTGADDNAKAFIAKNNDKIRKLLARLNAQGSI